MNDYAESNNLDVTNPAPRCPVILLLDTSGSMSGEPLRELQSGLDQFLCLLRRSIASQQVTAHTVSRVEEDRQKQQNQQHIKIWNF